MFGIDDAIGLGGSLLGGWLQSRAAKKAAEEQRKAAEAAAAQLTQQAGQSSQAVRDAGFAAADNYQRAGDTALGDIRTAGTAGQQMLTDATGRFNPYSDAGASALQRLQAGIAPGGEFSGQFTGSTDGYRNEAGTQYRIKQAQDALINSGLASGLVGGNTARALDEQTQAIASDEYGKAFDRASKSWQMNRDNALNPLMSLVGVGERANSNILQGSSLGANFGMNTANSLASTGLDTARGVGTFRTGAVNNAEGINMDAARQVADLRTGGAAAGAAGTIGSGNAWADAISNAGRSVDWGGLRTKSRGPKMSPARTGSVDAPFVYA